jgi:hypothetical protein
VGRAHRVVCPVVLRGDPGLGRVPAVAGWRPPWWGLPFLLGCGW